MHGLSWILSSVLALVLGVALATPAGAAMPDAWITMKTKLALLTTAGVSGRAINVDTVFGRVTLHGTVRSAEEQAKAETIARQIPVSVYGMGAGELRAHVPTGLAETADLSQTELHQRVADHLAYLHPYRWTSLGLSLVEAMTLGCPVLVNAATAAPESVPAEAGVVSSSPAVLAQTALRWRADRDEAREIGLAGRRHALRRFGLSRFLDDWDHVLKEVCR